MTNQTTELKKAKKIIRFPHICTKTGLPRSTIYRLIAQGKFPKQIKLSERTSGFLESEIDDWLESCAKNRDA
jgi:prophage regulatory protein